MSWCSSTGRSVAAERGQGEAERGHQRPQASVRQAQAEAEASPHHPFK